MSKILGIDFGTKKVGLAISDELKFLAHELKTIYHNDENAKVVNEIKAIVMQNKVEKIVLGVPKNMDGTIGEQAEIVYNFKKLLEEVNIPIIEIDERLTTNMAKNQLKESGLSEKKMKKDEDARAAAIILQQYLDFY